jgi:hypothetical protein
MGWIASQMPKKENNHESSLGWQNGTAHFGILIDYRGHHRKGVAIFNAP